MKNKGDVLRCSFCNKSQKDVKKLIAGPTVYICDECVDICLSIIAEDGGKVDLATGERVPKALVEIADKVTPGHAAAKQLLAAAIAQHAFLDSQTPSSSLSTHVLLVGPSGTGKNEIVRAMVRAADLPLAALEVPLLFPNVRFNATHRFPNFDKKPGVVLLKQFDAAAMRRDDKEECRRVQQSLISILDGAFLDVTGEDKPIVLDTSRVLFIALGAFPDLIIAPGERLGPDVLIRYGYLPELVARFGTLVIMEPLGNEYLRELLTRDGGLIDGCKKRFENGGLLVAFEPAAIDLLVRLGDNRKSGIRGLKAMVDTLGLALACEAPEGGGKFLVDETFVVRNLR